MSLEMLGQAKHRLAKENSANDSLPVEPRQICLKQDEQLFCFVSALPMLHQDENAIADYQRAIAEKLAEREVKQGAFTYKGLKFYQTLAMSKEMVLFKLVIPQTEKRSFQIDYIVPLVYYQKNLQAIESSIGSIEKQ